MCWASEKVRMGQGALIYVLLLILGTVAVRGKYLEEECQKSPSTFSPQSSDLELTCKLRTINSEFDKTNFSSISGDSVVSLMLECSDVLFYQSSLQPGSLSHFSRLGSLHIEHCKLSRLPPSVFAGLSLLKNLTLRTHNTAWPVLSLDIASGVFSHLPHLEKVDISSNNIWTFPDRLFCPASSLESLNVSLNRLQDISDLGFRERDEKDAQFGQRESGCKLGLQIVDISYNRLILLPGRALSTLRNLRELYLQGNEISVVADRALAGLKGLRILNLSANRIVALPETLFRDSPEMTEIYFQNNSLSSLPPNIFTNLDQLVVLDLSHNSLTSQWMSNNRYTDDFNSNDSSTTSQPSSTSLSSQADEKKPGIFSGLIRLVLLNLGYNKIRRLMPEPFQDLYSLQILNVEHNSIDTIDPNTFSAMNNLHTLILSHNKLTFIDASALNGLFVLSLLSLDNNSLEKIHPAALHNCSSLKDLNLNGNAFTEIPLAVQNLTLLKTVDLGENQIEQLQSPKLIGLPNLYGLRMTGNRVANVTKSDLKDLPSLKVLNLARNQLTFIEPGSFDLNKNINAIRLDANYITDISNLFTESPNLIWLNISDNRLKWFDYAYIPSQLQWLSINKNEIEALENYHSETNDLKLQTLDASFNRLTSIGSKNLPSELQQIYLNDNLISSIDPHTFYKMTNLSRVDIFANQIETMDFKALQLFPFPEDKPLPEFYIGGNPFICDCTMEYLTRLSELTVLRTFPHIPDFDSIYCKLLYHRDKLYVPLADANPSEFLCSYNTHCFALCNCCSFTCDCEMICPDNCTCYHDDTWSANIVDCSANGDNRLTSVPPRIPMDSTEVYLDGNHFEELNSHSFIGKKNLRVLYLNNTNLNVIQNNSLSGLKRLVKLHLENNFLTELQGYEFEPLESVKELYLQENQISFIANNTFATLRHLEVLRLDGNRLQRFAVWSFRSSNPYLVEIGLTANPWDCSCEFVSQAAPWIQNNVAKLRDAQAVNCRLNGRSLSLVYMNMNGTKCSEIAALSPVEAPESISLPPYLPLLLVVMGIIFLIGSVFVAVCRRNSLRIWAVAKCPLNHCYQTTLDDDREKLYDAYVAYSVKDESWVSQVFANELQQQCDNPYRLCFHYKDFPVTGYIADTIVEAAEASKRTVLVLSKNFIQSEWCKFEFKSALHAALRGRNRLVAITLGDFSTRDMDPDLRVCLKSATIIAANDKLFFAKLRYALPNPRASYSNSTRTLTRPGSGSSVASSVSNTYNCSTGGGSTLPLNVNGNMGNHTISNSHHNHSHHQLQHQLPLLHANGTMPHHNNSVSVPLYVPPFPPPNRPPPPFPAPRRPPPPTPLWA